MFHGDQKTITLVVSCPNQAGMLVIDPIWQLPTYNVLDGIELYHDRIPSLYNARLGAHWVYKDVLWFAIEFETNGAPTINICTFQPTSTPPLYIVSSFPVQSSGGKFSFSPISFHASYLTETKIIILNVQDSRILLDAQVDQGHLPPGQFSPDGHFFACRISAQDITIWQNAPTGYIPWGSLSPRLCPHELLWSPTSTSILCQCLLGILLLQLEHHPSPLSLNRNELDNKEMCHLVAYSTDPPYIAMTRKKGHVVTVLDLLSGSSQQFINTDIKIRDIKIMDGTVFVVGKYKLACWDLKAGEIPHTSHHLRVDTSLSISGPVDELILSYDCSQIAFTTGVGVFLYDIKAQRVLKSTKWVSHTNLQFSTDMCQLLCGKMNYLSGYCLIRLEMEEDWDSVQATSWGLQDKWSWVNLFSSCGYYVGKGSQWVVDSRGNKLLWLPPNWRALIPEEVRWDGNFLALVGGQYIIPNIIEFQPWCLDPSPSFTSTSFAKYVIPLSQHLHTPELCSYW